MILLQEPTLSSWESCSYLPDRKWRFEYFFAMNLTSGELEGLLEKGWRKFGTYFFRPQCDPCRSCIPVRVLTQKFTPTKSQRRVLRKCADIKVSFSPLQYSERIYEIYRDHSLNRFNRITDRDDFIHSFYFQSCPGLQSEYYLGGQLIAAGFLDRSDRGFSSVYFVFDTAYESYSLGTFSIIKEIEHAASIDLTYYYLGYYIEENRSMSYKNNFKPTEQYDWETGTWRITEN